MFVIPAAAALCLFNTGEYIAIDLSYSIELGDKERRRNRSDRKTFRYVPRSNHIRPSLIECQEQAIAPSRSDDQATSLCIFI